MPLSYRRSIAMWFRCTNSHGNTDSRFTTGQQRWLPVSGSTGNPEQPTQHATSGHPNVL